MNNLEVTYEAMVAANLRTRRAFEKYLAIQDAIAESDYRRNEAELQSMLDSVVAKVAG